MPRKTCLLSCMHPGATEAGCDEAGRGPIAGPVFAAAVILPDGFSHPLLDDSKKMSPKARALLRTIIEKEAVAWAVEEVGVEEIDTLNILWASVTGMQRAVRKLSVRPDFLLVDGNRFRKHRGRFGACQDPQGRKDAGACKGISRVRLGEQHGISHARTHRGAQTLRPYTLPPQVVPPESAGTDPVLKPYLS